MDFFAPLVQSDELKWIRNDIILERDSIYFDFSASGLESRMWQIECKAFWGDMQTHIRQIRAMQIL